MDEHQQDPLPWPSPAFSITPEWAEEPDEAEVPTAGALTRVLGTGLVLLAVLAAAGGFTLLSGSDAPEETVAGTARGSAETASPVERKMAVERPRITRPKIAVRDAERADRSRTRIRVWRGTDRRDVNVIRHRKPQP